MEKPAQSMIGLQEMPAICMPQLMRNFSHECSICHWEIADSPMGSPRGVPVPWTARQVMLLGAKPAAYRVVDMSACCEMPFGAVRLLDLPSWLTADPYMKSTTGGTALHGDGARLHLGRPKGLGNET